MISIKRFAFSLTILVLTGCIALEPISPIMVTETLPQICQAAKSNQVRANSTYVGMGLTIVGEVRTINEGFKPRYRVLLKAGQVSIHAGTDNESSVTALTIGNTARASGVITDVSNDYNGCSISLKDSTF